MIVVNFNDALGILISAFGGAAVGLEREWSGHAKGPKARFAGIRTFTLLGLQAGLAGWFWSNEQRTLATALIAAASALIVAPMSRRAAWRWTRRRSSPLWWFLRRVWLRE